MSVYDNDNELALSLARRLLSDALGDEPPKVTEMTRVLSLRIGELEQGIRAALAVIEELTGAAR